MDYKQSVQWLDSLGQRMEGFDLSNIAKLCALSGIEPAKLKAVHVAGSNGKGSTCAFAERILREAGYKTGLYTSPHILEPTERIQINGKKISEKEFCEIAEYYRELIEKNKIDASYFEAITAMAFKFFIGEKIDILVAEVGMGGRLDATNVLNGAVCVITSISLEHTQYLGDTIEKIAMEKAGIIKEKSIVVASPANVALRIIGKIAKQKNAELIIPEWKISYSNSKGNEIMLQSPKRITRLGMPLIGRHQCENAALAVAAALALRENGFRIPEKAIKSGLQKTVWRGRIEIVRKEPLVLLDAAHNPQGWDALFESLRLFKYENLFVVFGAMADKDVSGIGEKFRKLGAQMIFTKADSERAQEPQKLLDEFGFGEVAVPAADAIKIAIERAGKNDLVLVTGSINLVGEACRHLKIKI